MSEHKGVWVFSDMYDLMLEMLGKGREIADKLQSELVVVLPGKGASDKANELVRYGADTVYVVENDALESFQAEACLGILHDLVLQHKPEVVLVGSTRNGKPLAARLATRLEAGCVPDCNRLSVDESGWLVGERIAYGGNASAKIVFKTKPQVATVPSRAFEKPEPKEHKGEVVRIDAKPVASRFEVVGEKPLESSGVRLEDAEVIVSCGRGLGKKEDRVLLDELAGVLGGQVGSSMVWLRIGSGLVSGLG